MHGDEAGLTAEEAAVRKRGGGRSAREETDRRMDEQTARGRERKKGTQARAKAKPVKYDACRDVGNDAERVFPQLGSRSLGGEEEEDGAAVVRKRVLILIDPNNDGEIRLIASSAVARFVTTPSSNEQLVPFGLKRQNKTAARAQNVYR